MFYALKQNIILKIIKISSIIPLIRFQHIYPIKRENSNDNNEMKSNKIKYVQVEVTSRI